MSACPMYINQVQIRWTGRQILVQYVFFLIPITMPSMEFVGRVPVLTASTCVLFNMKGISEFMQ